ncbi:MAG: ACT domain-containing protein [Sphaerochaetaceae bacterium]|nr:ACT domain-containing protein [Sphaerochaetaceae bacterium]
MNDRLTIEILNDDFSICKVVDYSEVSLDNPFVFMACTDEERSLVCSSALVPSNVTECENGWTAFRIVGTLDFSLTGIIARIASLLAERKIGVFVVSTFNTDYVLIRKETVEAALSVLLENGYAILRH